MQFISTEPGSSMAVVDLTEVNPSERASRLRHLIEKQGQDAFDLAHGHLVRPAAFKLGREEYILSLAMHHIVSDGWSMVVLVRELTELYIACKEGRLDPLPPLAIQYADFAYWQRQRLSGDFLEKQLNYWRKQLSNISVLELQADHPRPGKEIYRGSRCDFRIGEETAERLRGLARRNHASLFMVMLAAWQALLYRYSGQRDILLGPPIAHRPPVPTPPLLAV